MPGPLSEMDGVIGCGAFRVGKTLALCIKKISIWSRFDAERSAPGTNGAGSLRMLLLR